MMSVFEIKVKTIYILECFDVYGKISQRNTIKGYSEEVNKMNIIKSYWNGLECFTFQSYIDYLFTKRAFQNEAEVIKEAKSALLERSGFSRKEVIKT